MTYCVAVKEELLIGTCPLRKGQCYWQHRETQSCCYTEEELTPEEFASRVGTSTVNTEEAEAITAKIRNEVNL